MRIGFVDMLPGIMAWRPLLLIGAAWMGACAVPADSHEGAGADAGSTSSSLVPANGRRAAALVISARDRHRAIVVAPAAATSSAVSRATSASTPWSGTGRTAWTTVSARRDIRATESVTAS